MQDKPILFDGSCDVLDAAKVIATEANTTTDQALKAMEIAALLEVIKQLGGVGEAVWHI